MSVDDFMDALSGIPRLPGALCRGRAAMFDNVAMPEAEEALELCAVCPALSDCRKWVDGLPHAQRPHGVVAGRVRKSRAHHHKRRKPKNTA